MKKKLALVLAIVSLLSIGASFAADEDIPRILRAKHIEQML